MALTQQDIRVLQRSMSSVRVRLLSIAERVEELRRAGALIGYNAILLEAELASLVGQMEVVQAVLAEKK